MFGEPAFTSASSSVSVLYWGGMRFFGLGKSNGLGSPGFLAVRAGTVDGSIALILTK